MFGLAVLVALGLYVSLAKAVVQIVAKRTKSKSIKYATLAVFVLIPTWDIIPGQLYHQHLCKSEGGVKVFKTIKIAQEYFLPNGQPDERKLLLERLYWQTSMDRTFSKVFHITKHQGILIDKETGEHLGTATQFSYFGGWLHTTILIEAAPDSCPQFGRDVYGTLYRQVIYPRVSGQ